MQTSPSTSLIAQKQSPFDCETTGLGRTFARIVQFAAITAAQGQHHARTRNGDTRQPGNADPAKPRACMASEILM